VRGLHSAGSRQRPVTDSTEWIMTATCSVNVLKIILYAYYYADVRGQGGFSFRLSSSRL
jgi:hypothetical protein